MLWFCIEMFVFCIEMFAFCTKNVRFCVENVRFCTENVRRLQGVFDGLAPGSIYIEIDEICCIKNGDLMQISRTLAPAGMRNGGRLGLIHTRWASAFTSVYTAARLSTPSGYSQVSFQWKNTDFLLKNVDFLLKNTDFIIQGRSLKAG